MVHLYTPRSEIELLLLRSVFDGAGIRFYVRNEAFAVGPQMAHWNGKSIWVLEAHFEEAILLLREFHRRTAAAAPRVPDPAPSRGLRAVLARLTLAWRAPRRGPPGPPELRLIRNDRPEPAAARERPPLRLL
jgi:hypothetical protein